MPFVENSGGGAASSSTTVTQTTQSGASYTAVLADAGTLVRMTNASNPTFTVPPNSSVAFQVGTVISVYAAGAGGATVAAGAGVTIQNNSPATMPQFSEISLRQDAADTWVRIG